MDDVSASTIERISTYRDRFSAWGLVVGFVSAIAAVWTTAPTLDVGLPFVGGTEVGINVGYVMMAGPLLIVLALAWMMGPLLSARRLQEAVVRDVESGAASGLTTQLREVLGPFVLESTDDLLARVAYRLFGGVRILVYFLCPVLGIMWIVEAYFADLYAYNKEQATAQTLSVAERNMGAVNPSNWNIPSKERITFLEYFIHSKPRDKTGNRLNRFIIGNSDLERACMQLWIRDNLRDEQVAQTSLAPWKGKLLTDLSERTKNLSCAADAFPKFELAINSWINVLSFLLSIWIARMGWNLYSTEKLARRIEMLSGEVHED